MFQLLYSSPTFDHIDSIGSFQYFGHFPWFSVTDEREREQQQQQQQRYQQQQHSQVNYNYFSLFSKCHWYDDSYILLLIIVIVTCPG
jgi:predicted alpha-1,6-mannanase (GH76 family)